LQKELSCSRKINSFQMFSLGKENKHEVRVLKGFREEIQRFFCFELSSKTYFL
jgi:hypothetical protein